VSTRRKREAIFQTGLHTGMAAEPAELLPLYSGPVVVVSDGQKRKLQMRSRNESGFYHETAGFKQRPINRSHSTTVNTPKPCHLMWLS
jgi:hypothetical protein